MERSTEIKILKVWNKARPKKRKKGDCYEVHGRFMLDNPDASTVLLCHGVVWGDAVGWHGHAWLEIDGDMVLDMSNGQSRVVERELYYDVGKVKDVKRYTRNQAADKMLEFGHFGDWD